MAAAISQMDDDGVDKGKVVYCQDGVCVHTAVPTATQFANIISGKVTVVEKENSSFVDWSPIFNEEEEFELESSAYSEWNLITQSKHEGDADANTSKRKRRSKYAIFFDTAELHSIKRSDPKLGWSYAVFILKDGTTLPALHFHSGGISELIRRLQRYIWITNFMFAHVLTNLAKNEINILVSFLLYVFREEYRTMKLQWQSMTQTQEKNFAEFRERKQLIDKDVARTDRQTDFYSEANHPNLTKLYDILLTYCMYNFDLGYVQGMSDLLSPILVVMENEVEAFWCFVGFMEKLVGHNKSNLNLAVYFILFKEHDSGNMYFCFRWLLITFKREFSFPDIMLLWETLWSQKLSPNYHLIVCLAILDMHRNAIMENELGFTYILKYINDLAYTIDVQEVLIRAEQLCLQLRVYPGLPVEVKAILRGKNEAMMTPNVERMDPFLVVHSKHLDLLKDYGVVNANSAVRTLDLTASDLGESTHELNTNEETSSESAVQTTWNDLGNGVRPGTISVRNEGGPNENGNNEDQLSDGEEIVVLSEEAQNIF
ncbi:PREDICTED: TBC1 domain family member 15-like [Acropora digitifera]|uniref:TBC1 domain family member 15-like n=1 Tax=Acropora digitifera TaxID=70779 RepID=UPI00077ACBD2|nr:PREDICTED: TBC1 domain family member 15-like [Acropora digitifera]